MGWLAMAPEDEVVKPCPLLELELSEVTVGMLADTVDETAAEVEAGPVAPELVPVTGDPEVAEEAPLVEEAEAGPTLDGWKLKLKELEVEGVTVCGRMPLVMLNGVEPAAGPVETMVVVEEEVIVTGQTVVETGMTMVETGQLLIPGPHP